jgi:hypothetical protein
MGFHNKITKKGLEMRETPRSVEEIKALSDRAKELAELTRRLMFPLFPSDDKKMRGEHQFSFDGKWWQSKIRGKHKDNSTD